MNGIHLQLRWGNEVEVLADGKSVLKAPWDGLFGPLPVDKKSVSMIIGHPHPKSVDSEFTIDELMILRALDGQVGARPAMALPLLEDAPELDGELNDPFWENAGKVTGFVAFDQRRLKTDQPDVQAAYTNEGIYIAARMPLPEGRPARASLTSRDAAIYSEDTLEFFLQPPGFTPSYYQFMVNAIGTRFDITRQAGKRPDMGYNPDWQAKTGAEDGAWQVEIFVPFKAFGLSAPPEAGSVWRGSFVVDSANGFPNAATWAFADGDFSQSVNFGDILFMGTARTLRQERFTGFTEGNPKVDFRLVGPFPPAITVKAEIFDRAGNPVHEESVLMNDSKTITVGAEYLQAGVYSARLSAVDEAGTRFFAQNAFFKPEKSFSLTVEHYPYAGEAVASANAAAIRDKAKGVRFSLHDANGQELAQQRMETGTAGFVTAKFDTEELAPARYIVKAAALDGAGNVVEASEHGLRIFPKPIWWKSDLGFDHSVPPPWTPVKSHDKGYAVWGRDYQFDGRVFPKQIVSQGVKMLSGAPKLLVRSGGEEWDALAMTGRVADEMHPDMASLSAVHRSNGLIVESKGALEFDGCYRFDVTFKPDGAERIDGMTLEIPIAREVGRFLQVSSGKSSSILPLDKPFVGRFAPYLWIGNDDMGLAWFCESDQYWRPEDARMVEVIPDGKTTLLRLNIRKSPLPIKEPVSFTFGLMASPVRPVILNDPFYDLIYSGPAKVQYPEALTYASQGAMTGTEGSLAFDVRLTEAGKGKTVEVLNLMPVDRKLPDLTVFGARNALCMNMGNKRLVTVGKALPVDAFARVEVRWNAAEIALLVDGAEVGKAALDDAFRASLTSAFAEGGRVQFGCRSDYRGFTAIVLDNIAVSPKADGSAPVLADSLDETFLPDGEDAFTKAGGLATVGCRFVPGKAGQGLRLEVAPAKAAADIARESAATFGLAWNWNTKGRSQFGWPPVLFGPHAENLKDTVDQYHSYGLKIMPYHAYPAIGGPSQLEEQFGAEWGRKPRSAMPYPPPEGHFMLNASLSARGFGDYLTEGAAWVMDAFGFDGIYTDGIGNVNASENLYHRAGYIDENGRVRATVPIWGVRETMKRMYKVVKAKKPDGMVINHVSYNLLIPTMSFSDIYYTGEHEDYTNLGHVRLRFSSKPWGIQASLLGASSHIYSSLHTMIGLLHGTPIMGHGAVGRNDLTRKIINIRSAYERFDVRSATWKPYFRNAGEYFTLADPEVHVSFYYHEGKDILLIVGNLNKTDKEVAIPLKLSAFGLAGAPLKARNALTTAPLSLTAQGALAVPVRAGSFTLVQISR